MRAVSRVVAGTVLVVSGVVLTVGTGGAAPPKPAVKEMSAPALNRPAGAMQPVGGVQSGQMPLPDLSLERLNYLPGERKGTNPDGTACFGFRLQPVFRNIGDAGTGPFKIVWEKATAQQGPFTLACEACTAIIQNASPGVGMLPEPRLTSSCQGYRWFRVRLDTENVVIELREDNNAIVEFH